MTATPKFADIKNAVDSEFESLKPIPHSEVLGKLLEEVEEVNFKDIAFGDDPTYVKTKEAKAKAMESLAANPHDREAKETVDTCAKILNAYKLTSKHRTIIAIEETLRLAKNNCWQLAKRLDFTYIYNGAYWSYVERDALKTFLGEAAERLGVDKFNARHFQFRSDLLKQFEETANLPEPPRKQDTVLINLTNGTLEISTEGARLREHRPEDFLTYQLPFSYQPQAQAPRFQDFLNRVLPDAERQAILAEFLGYVFIGNKTLKLEKALLLYGTGANGKSVFFEIVNALLGKENISYHSLSDLTNESGYYRATIANKLVNYASEINGKVEASHFKAMASGEPINARLPYGEPMNIAEYAKLIFNCNELPKEVEHTEGFFRRFLIVPFDVTIPQAEQDPSLSQKIIETELPGVLNWALAGLSRLLERRKFTEAEAVTKALAQFRKESNSVDLFLDESELERSSSEYTPLKSLYQDYRAFALEAGYKPVNRNNFKKRLESLNVEVKRKTQGLVAYVGTAML